MSFYATLTGYVQYRTHDQFHAVLTRLQKGGWLDGGYQWTAENDGDRPIHPASIDFDQLLLVIPLDLYRNLARITTELFAGAVDGELVISSTDGCFDAWIERPLPEAAYADIVNGATPVSTIEHVDLVAFARDHGLGVKEFETTPPDEYAAWQDLVLTTFHVEFDPALPAIVSEF